MNNLCARWRVCMSEWACWLRFCCRLRPWPAGELSPLIGRRVRVTKWVAHVASCAAGLAVTSATVVIYGEAIIDPVQLLGRMEGLVPTCLSLFGEAQGQHHPCWLQQARLDKRAACGCWRPDEVRHMWRG